MLHTLVGVFTIISIGVRQKWLHLVSITGCKSAENVKAAVPSKQVSSANIKLLSLFAYRFSCSPGNFAGFIDVAWLAKSV